MKSPTMQHVRHIASNKRHQHKRVALLSVLAALVVLGVVHALLLNGRAATKQEQVLSCPVTGTVAHHHDDNCYDAEGKLVCKLPEVERHVHNDSCYREERTLVCGQAEAPAHWHDDSCYDEEGNLVCGLEETAGHTHSDSCYKVERTLVCGKEEVTEEHQHGPGCFKTVTTEVADDDPMPEQTFEHHFTDKNDKLVLKVFVDAPEGALPKGATMKVEWVPQKKLDTDLIDEAVAKKTDGKVNGYQAVDITFRDADGNEVEPAKKVTVTLTSGKLASDDTKPVLVHVESEKEAIERSEAQGKKEVEIEAQVVKPLTAKQLKKRDLADRDDQLVFDSDQFSVYAIVYTVDFHYSVDGKTYDLALQGGDAVSLRELLAGLKVFEAKDADYFMDEVKSVEFSDTSLVAVAQVGEDITAGELRERFGLEAQYSAEVTDEQIAAMDAKRFEPGDWALLSLKPFDSEETLTITMANGDVLTIKVTDAQLKKTVISDKGDTYEITVTYGEDAQIPEGAELKVREILPEDDDYESIYSKAEEALEEEKETGLTAPVMFDISIEASGEEVEPAEGSMVDVEIRLVKSIFDEKDSSDTDEAAEDGADSSEAMPYSVFYNGMAIVEDGQIVGEDGQSEVGTEEGNGFDVVHLADDGSAAVIDDLTTDSDEDSYVLTFATDSFSDYIINGDTADGKQYFLRNIPTTMYVGDTVYLYYENNWDEGNQTVNTNNGVASVYTPVNGDNRFREVRIENPGTFWIGNKQITVRPRQAGSHPATVSTLANDTIGVSMNMFDYDLDDSLDSHFNQFGNSILPYQRTYISDGINSGHVFKFWGSGIGTWGANQNNPAGVKLAYNQYNEGATTNIVQNTLSGGYPMLKDGEESLSYLFTPSNGTDKTAYTGVDGLFQKDADGYYYYDSNKNYAWLNPSSKQFEVYTTTYHQWSNSDASAAGGYDNGKAIGFFPYHEWNSSYDLFVNWNKNLNHHFGMEFDLSFELPNKNDGMAVVDRNGKPIVFEFSGDDDVWVFIDDKLVMDIGGIHQPVSGKIDFTNKNVTLSYTANGTTHDSTQVNSNSAIWNQLHLDDGQTHTLKMFYVERGGCDSNNMIKFNLTHYTNIEFEKLDKVTEEPLDGVTYELWEVIRYNDEQGNPQVRYEQAFWWENKNGTPVKHMQHVTTEADGKVSFKNVPVGEYVLKEISAPEGYALNQDKTIKVTLQKNSDKTFTAVWNKGDLDELGKDGVQVTNQKPVIDISVNKAWEDVDGQPMDASGYSATFTLRRTKSWTEIQKEEGEPQKTSTLKLGYVNGNNQYGTYDDRIYSFVEGSTATITYNYDDQHNGYNNNHRYYKIGQNGEQHTLNDSGSFTVTMPPAGQTLTVYFYDGFNNNSYWNQRGKYNAFTSLSAAGQAPQNTIVEHEIPHVDEPDDDFAKTLTLSNGATSGKFDSGLYAGTADAGKFPYQETIEQPDGTKITYTYKYYIAEETPAGFSSSPSEVGPTGEEDFTGEFVNRKLMSVKVKKIWDHGTNKGEKPASLTVTLSNGDSVTLDAGNNWEATIDNLPKYDSQGNEITYSWTEETLPPGYFLSSTETSASADGSLVTTTLTNAYSDKYDPKTSYVGIKTWDDNGRKRPQTVTINLKANGEIVDTKAISASDVTSNEWPFEFTNLPVFAEDGTVIQYTIEEVLPEGYTQQTENTAAVYTPAESPITVVEPATTANQFISHYTDLGFIVIGHGHDFVLWTPRIATEAEQKKIIDAVVGMNSQEFSSINSFGYDYVYGVPLTVGVGNKKAASVFMQGDDIYLKFLHTNAYSEFAYGFMSFDYTPASGSITNTQTVTDYDFTKLWVDQDGNPMDWDQDVQFTVKRNKEDGDPDASFSLVYNVSKDSVENASGGTAVYHAEGGSGTNPDLTLTVTQASGTKNYEFHLDGLAYRSDEDGVYTYYVEETNAQLEGYAAPVISGTTITNRQLPKTTDIHIQKNDADGEGLAGAVFTLQIKEGDTFQDIKSVKNEDGETLKYLAVSGLDDNSQFTSTDAASTIANLPDGEYQLVEVSAPDGYVITQRDIPFTIQNQTLVGEDVEGMVDFDGDTALVTVVNEPGAELPAAGGLGTAITNILGAMAISAVVFTNILQRRREFGFATASSSAGQRTRSRRRPHRREGRR